MMSFWTLEPREGNRKGKRNGKIEWNAAWEAFDRTTGCRSFATAGLRDSARQAGRSGRGIYTSVKTLAFATAIRNRRGEDCVHWSEEISTRQTFL